MMRRDTKSSICAVAAVMQLSASEDVDDSLIREPVYNYVDVSVQSHEVNDHVVLHHTYHKHVLREPQSPVRDVTDENSYLAPTSSVAEAHGPNILEAHAEFNDPDDGYSLPNEYPANDNDQFRVGLHQGGGVRDKDGYHSPIPPSLQVPIPKVNDDVDLIHTYHTSDHNREPQGSARGVYGEDGRYVQPNPPSLDVRSHVVAHSHSEEYIDMQPPGNLYAIFVSEDAVCLGQDRDCNYIEVIP